MREQSGASAPARVGADHPSVAAASISVVVPVYNKGAYVEECIRSVLAQSMPPLEIIVVDDGSSDDGADRVARLLRPGDRLIRQANAGVSAARNTGAAAARGSLVVFLDADDGWRPGFLSAIASVAATWPRLDMYATGYRQAFADGEWVDFSVEGADDAPMVLVEDFFTRIVAGPFLWIGCVAFRREAFLASGGFAEGVTHGEDIDLLTRVTMRSSIGYDRRILAVYQRDVPGSAMTARPVDSYASSLGSIDTALASGDVPDARRRALVRYRDYLWRRMAFEQIAAGAWDALGRLPALGAGAQVALLARASALPIVRPVVRAIERASRIPTSRVWLRLRGGRRAKGGVVMCLGRDLPAPAAPAWSRTEPRPS